MEYKRKEAIYGAYLDGLSMENVAGQFSICREYVRQIIREVQNHKSTQLYRDHLYKNDTDS